MATLEGSIQSIRSIREASGGDPITLLEVSFYVSGVYAQADDAAITDLAGQIATARKTPRTFTLETVGIGDRAFKASDPSDFLSLKTLAISGDDLTFEITDGDESTELANGAVPTQNNPFRVIVGVTEAA